MPDESENIRVSQSADATPTVAPTLPTITTTSPTQRDSIALQPQSSTSPRMSVTIPDRTAISDVNTVSTPAALRAANEEPESSLTLPISSSTLNNTNLTTPSIQITLLILSGARSSFGLSPEFLKKHNVNVSDPMAMSVYSLKECIWRDWNEGELNAAQPASPHLIRLILLGRLLEDKSLLKDCRLSTENPNVVHLSIRPADVGDDEGPSKSGKLAAFAGGNNSRGGERSSPGCRCVIL